MEFIIERSSGTEPPVAGARRHVCKMTSINGVFDVPVWVIDIKTLEEIMRLVASEGRMIIKPPGLCGLPGIEIYDDYRE